jgi:ADP-ribosylglycohydrolase
MKPERAERIRGGLWGLLVGDAVGVPYEFHRAEDLPPPSRIDMVPPPDFYRAHSGTPPGTWSDDGAQTLCLLASLLHCGGLDPRDLSRRLLNWASVGYMAVDHRVFDIGMQTQRAFERLRAGEQPLLAGPADEHANGNGSLMRVLPLALWHQGTDSELVRDACVQSRLTHGHPRSQAVCAFYCLWARELLASNEPAWDRAADRLRGCLAEHPQLAAETELILRPDHAASAAGSGYVLDTLWSARHALEAHERFDLVVRAAIAFGNDTDTTACVAGGLAGIRDGYAAIPGGWLDLMRGKELVEPLLIDLLALS